MDNTEGKTPFGSLLHTGYYYPYSGYSEERREANRASKRKWRANHRGYSSEYNKRIRLEVLEHYGGKCAWCGESNPMYLCIDHVDGGGNEHRKKISAQALPRWLKLSDYPEGFQVLCWNHNYAKSQGAIPLGEVNDDGY